MRRDVVYREHGNDIENLIINNLWMRICRHIHVFTLVNVCCIGVVNVMAI